MRKEKNKWYITYSNEQSFVKTKLELKHLNKNAEDLVWRLLEDLSPHDIAVVLCHDFSSGIYISRQTILPLYLMHRLPMLTVCSDKLIRTRVFPEAFANAATKLVLPTPGEPSRRMGLFSLAALKSLWAFIAVVPALSA